MGNMKGGPDLKQPPESKDHPANLRPCSGGGAPIERMLGDCSKREKEKAHLRENSAG